MIIMKHNKVRGGAVIMGSYNSTTLANFEREPPDNVHMGEGAHGKADVVREVV